jgi:hypothetical protein
VVWGTSTTDHGNSPGPFHISSSFCNMRQASARCWEQQEISGGWGFLCFSCFSLCHEVSKTCKLISMLFSATLDAVFWVVTSCSDVVGYCYLLSSVKSNSFSPEGLETRLLQIGPLAFRSLASRDLLLKFKGALTSASLQARLGHL